MRWIIVLALFGCASPPPPKPPPPPPQIRAIEFKVEESNLTTGDEIEVTSLHGDRPGCIAGGNFQIAGRYILSSRADAELVVSARGGETTNAERTVARGAGEFSFTFEIVKEGPLEVSFMKAGGGSSAGGILIRCAPGGAQ